MLRFCKNFSRKKLIMHHEEVAVLIRKTVQQVDFLIQQLEERHAYTAQRLRMPKACQIPTMISSGTCKNLSPVGHSSRMVGDREMISNFNKLGQSKTLNLIPGNIHRWTLRESHIVIEKIKALANQKSDARKIEAEILFKTAEQTSIDKISKEDEVWQDMLKAKPDRQFHLGRITTYFS
jgi:hypothetical protein